MFQASNSSNYIQEISNQCIGNILQAIIQYRQGKFSNPKILPRAIAAILEVELKSEEYQKFAVENHSQIVGIIVDKKPKYLAIKKDIEGNLFFQVDNEIVEPY